MVDQLQRSLPDFLKIWLEFGVQSSGFGLVTQTPRDLEQKKTRGSLHVARSRSEKFENSGVQ